MLQMVATMMFLGTGMFALAVIAAMLIDYQVQIQQALGLRPALPALPVSAARVRVVRSARLVPPLHAPIRVAA